MNQQPTPNHYIAECNDYIHRLIIRYLESGSLVLFEGENETSVKDLAKKYMQDVAIEITRLYRYDGSIVDLEDFQSLHEFLVGCGELEVLHADFITVIRGEQ